MKTYKFLPIMTTVLTLLTSGYTSSTDQTEVETGQHPQTLEKEIVKTLKGNYLLHIPEQYLTSQKDWPLILFLHGAGERGNDIKKVEKHGPPKLIAKGKKEFPFIVVSPQCPEETWWSAELQIDFLNALLDDLVSRYRIDKQRIYVTGLSLGGFGTWSLAAAYPDRFAAIAPICGDGNPVDAESIAHLPIWVFHGAKDKVVPIEKSEEMVAALKKAGSDVKFTVYPDAGHNSWTATYENPELYEWFLEHTLSDDE
jgi:predicted peptidase